MAFRSANAAAYQLERTSDLLDNGADFTVMVWARRSGGDYSYFERIVGLEPSSDPSETYYFCSLGWAGTTPYLRVRPPSGAGDTGYVDGSSVTAGTWTHFTFVRSGDDFYMYQNGVQTATANAPWDISTLRMIIGHQADTSGADRSEFQDYKAWSAALTVAEIQRERLIRTPVRRANLFCWQPVHGNSSTYLLDYSGHGRDFSTSQSITMVSGPAVPWRRQHGPQLFWPPAAPGGGGGVTVTPGTASLSLTPFAPVVSTPSTVTPGVAELQLTPFAPLVSASDQQTVTPGTASLTLTAFTPDVTAGGSVTAIPGTAELALTAFAPQVSSSADQTAIPGTASLTLTAFAPDVGAPRLVVPQTGELLLTPYGPYVDFGIVVGEGSLVLTAFAPEVNSGITLVPDAGELVLTAYVPDVATSSPVSVVSVGRWDQDVRLDPGDEYLVTLDGPAADAPRVRLVLRFHRSPNSQ